MKQADLINTLLDGTAPKNLRLLAARQLIPLPPREMIELLVALLEDKEQDVASQAARTMEDLDREDIIAHLKTRDCASSVLAHFASASNSEPVLRAVIEHPNSPRESLAALALNVPRPLLEALLDNRARILEFPEILDNIKRNSDTTPEIERQIQEIETEFFGDKKKEYAIEQPEEMTPTEDDSRELLEADIPLEDLSLEGLPVDPETRESALFTQLSKMQIREKLRYALFGNREIRMALVRDSNKQVARMVLRSPKLTENEVETISAMRNVTDEILREIGVKKEWTKSNKIVRNLVKNPRTPPAISQRLLFRLRLKDLQLLTRDRNIPEAVRRNAVNMVNQRTKAR